MLERPSAVLVFSSLLGVVGCESDNPSPGGQAGASSVAGTGGATGGQTTAGAAGSSAGSSSGSGGGGTAGSAQGGAGGAGAGGISNAGTGTGGETGGASSGAGGGGTGGGGGGKLPGSPVVFVGGYGASFPVRAYNLDKATGALTQRGADFDAGTDPSYLALNPARTHLYAANENDGANGGVTALRIGADGSLVKLNHQAGSDLGFTYLAVDPTGKFVVAASYNGGSVSVFPISADGSLGAQVSNLDFGSGAQAHSVGFDKAGKYAFVPSKGAGQVQQLLLATDGKLSANTPPNVAAAAGAGPRHIAMHPNGKLAFVANELNSTVTPYQVSSDGKLTAGTSVSSVPAGFQGSNTGAHVELSPDGRFVYASNRGHDSIAVFSADQTSGALTLVETEPSRGQSPRDFDVDPNGDVIVVANQNSSTLSVFKIEANGALTPLGTPTPSASMPSAVQIHYVP